MNNNTTITYEKVRQDANVIRNCATVMRNIFEDFGTSMNAVGADDVFAGNASESLGSRFASLKTKFDSYVQTVETFASMITSAASATEATEQAIKSETDSLAG